MAKENKTQENFINPFEVSYSEFIKALGDKSVKEYLTGKNKKDDEPFSEADINWLSSEVENHIYNEAHKKENLERAEKEHQALTIENEREVK